MQRKFITMVVNRIKKLPLFQDFYEKIDEYVSDDDNNDFPDISKYKNLCVSVSKNVSFRSLNSQNFSKSILFLFKKHIFIY